MQTGNDARKNRAAFRTCFITNRDDLMKNPAGIKHIKHGFGSIAGNINSDFPHRFHDNGIEFAGFKSGTVRLKFIAANLLQECLGHLAAGAVVDANEKDVLFHSTL